MVDQDDRPIACILDPKRLFFRVTRAKGKALASGGFGISLLEEGEKQSKDYDEDDVHPSCSSDHANQASIESSQNGVLNKDDVEKTQNNGKKATEILFIEEVVFLHERGLLTATTKTSPVDTSQLYQLLPKMGMSLSIYFVYSHLRSQDFRVLRHDPERLDILRQQQQQQEGLSKADFLLLRRQVRASIQNAPPPSIPTDTSKRSSVRGNALQICWDAYNPSAQFAKTHPGPPDFLVAVTHYNTPLVRFSEVKNLIHEEIPLKIATVSDSGTVVMFGVTDYGIPPLADKDANEDA